MNTLSAHPAADAFPWMNAERLSELVEDIRVHGLREPITICDGMILDGRNRYRACMELGIEPDTREFDGDPWAYVWSLNGQRRDLVDEQRYLIWKHCNEHSEGWLAEQQRIREEANRKRSEAAKERTRTNAGTFEPVVGQNDQPLDKEAKARKSKAAAAKVNPSTVKRGDTLAKKRPDLAEKVRLGEMQPALAHRAMRKDATSRREEEALATMPVDGDWAVTNSLDVVACNAVITDPPYGILDEEWEPDKLEEFTRDWLLRWNESEADFLVSFWSQRYLWEGRKWFDEALPGYKFQHLLVWHYANNKKPQSQMGFKQTWEPIFFYRRRDSEKRVLLSAVEWGGDLHCFDCHVAAVPQSNFNDVDMKQHPAQKPVSAMRWLINVLSRPGEMICDPFCGSGTTGVAAVQLRRRFHGIETGAEFRELARRRIAAYGTTV